MKTEIQEWHRVRTTSADRSRRARNPADQPRRINATALVLATFLVGAVLVTWGLWREGSRAMLSANVPDQVFFQFVLRHAVDVLAGDATPFFTSQMNAPLGVNLMANTVVLGLGIPLAPLTVLGGPQLSFTVLLVLGLAGTAAAWYWFLLRHVVSSRAAAAVGAALCGFGPGMISQANGHPNWTAQFLVPFLVHWALRMAEPGRALRNGAVLGLLVVVQAFVNEEVLLYTALACAVFLTAYAALTWPAQRAAIRPVLATAGVAAVLGERCSRTPSGRSSSGRRVSAGCHPGRPPTGRTWPASRPSRGCRWAATSTSPGCSRRTRPRRTRSWAGRCWHCSGWPWRAGCGGRRWSARWSSPVRCSRCSRWGGRCSRAASAPRCRGCGGRSTTCRCWSRWCRSGSGWCCCRWWGRWWR
ncbi:hypothetical protein ACFQY4_42770 [Catellatospora bangladeshensis]|uniref:hypothetical protein n=1 Tax=Catellatospora bangladeshensis TaxID=310355 RepID=UPI00361604DD